MNKLATIEKIHNFRCHSNAERLDCAKVLGWPVVIKKGEFKEGELVVFITIDSIVPSTNPYFSFMERQKYRVWSAKFRGEPSQGLVCPLSILPPGEYKEGDDVSSILCIQKYEKPEPVCTEALDNFPTNLIPITDEDNLQSYPSVLEEFKNKESIITLKADGASGTIIYHNNKIRVCSRRLEQKPGTGFWPVFESLDLPNKLIKLNKNLAIQAEVCGPGIQSNRLDLSNKQFFVFTIRDLDTREYYSWLQIKDLCNDLGLQTVKELQAFNFNDTWNIEKLQNIANSVVYAKQPGEGIVLRPVVPIFSYTLNKQLSVKIVNQNYK